MKRAALAALWVLVYVLGASPVEATPLTVQRICVDGQIRWIVGSHLPDGLTSLCEAPPDYPGLEGPLDPWALLGAAGAPIPYILTLDRRIRPHGGPTTPTEHSVPEPPMAVLLLTGLAVLWVRHVRYVH